MCRGGCGEVVEVAVQAVISFFVLKVREDLSDSQPNISSSCLRELWEY